MPNIPKNQEGYAERHEIVNIGPNKLLMTIRTGVTDDLIYMGSKKVYCIYALVPKYIDEAPDEQIDTGTFQELKYDNQCALGDNLATGVDSTLLVKLMVTYIARKYPYIKELRFSDASYKTCDDGTRTELSEMTYLTIGKTWYEKHFDAFVEYDSNSSYTRDMEYVQQKKNTTTWDHLLKRIPSLRKFEDMRGIYENATTWQEFFSAVRDRLGGIAQFCMFASKWLHIFTTQYLRLRFTKYTYILPIKDYGIQYTTESYTSGGGRRKMTKTMKRRK